MGMLSAIAKIADEFDLAHQCAVEEAMACGIPIDTAWRILRAVGLNDLGKIRSRPTSEYPDLIEPQYAQPVSLALRTLGCLLYQDRSKGFDRAAQVLDRAVALAPNDPACVEDFADVACRITPDDIRAFNDRPHKKLETVIGYNRAASKATEHLLEARFGISRAALTEESGELLQQALAFLQPEEKRYLARSLNRLSWLFLQEGSFFENGTLLSLAVAASCSHLQALGLPRGAMDCVTIINESLECGSVLQDLGEDLATTCNALEVLSSAFYKKGKLFRNYAATRRSERIDRLLDAIETEKSRHNPAGDGTTT
jgi:hypothetical protein